MLLRFHLPAPIKEVFNILDTLKEVKKFMHKDTFAEHLSGY